MDVEANIQPIETFDFSRTREDIENYSTDSRIIMFCKNEIFRFLSTEDASKLISYLLNGRGPDGEVYFKRDHLSTSKKFVQYNRSKFDKDKNNRIVPDVYKEIREKLFRYIKDLLSKESQFREGLKRGEITEDEKIYWINKEATFEMYRKLVIDEMGDCTVKYDFEKPDLEISKPELSNTIQRININIVSSGVNFSYPMEYTYYCRQCNTRTKAKVYEVACNTKNGLSCPGVYTYTTTDGELKSRLCKAFIYPDVDLSKVKQAYFYEANYEEEGQQKSAQAISFMNISPGKYEAIVYAVPGNKTTTFQIIDVKKPETNIFKLPKHKDSENYLFTLQKAMDNYIEEKTGVRIYGLNPIKCALILQTLANHLKERLSLNVMIVGDPSTGKSLVLKYYPFLLNHYYNLSSNGLSISVPGLRGTRSTINLFGKDIKIVTVGHLGSYRSIHIDEAGENKELVQNLKSFLLEDNYSYDKAGSVGVSSKRTSHVNISQNLDYEHVGQYRGAIRKAYKDLNMTMDGIEKEDWDESWDLFLPIHKYENPQLRKVVREKRLEFKQKMVFWIDGLDYALHERFPFYFYLVNEKPNSELDEVISLNGSRTILTENLEILRAVYTEEIEKFFKELVDFKHSKGDIEAFKKVRQIVKEYGFIFDARTLIIFQTLLRFSRVINKREEYKDMDYDIVRWYLEKTNVKIDVTETNDYHIQGPPDLLKTFEQQKTEEASKSGDDVFGLPEGEFN
jgi:hypothetical protein